MKKIEIDSLFGIYANVLLVIMLLFTWQGTDFQIIIILPFIAVAVEIFVLTFNFDAKKFEYKKQVVLISKAILLLAPLIVLINNIVTDCLFCEEILLLNIVLFSFVIVQLLATIYVRFIKKTNPQ